MVGGIEAYLGSIIPELQALGHEVGFWYEVEEPAQRAPIALPAGVAAWSVAELGAERALGALREWRPDVLYAHGLLDPALEAALYGLAPAVFFPHDYHGTCVSGYKTTRVPEIQPCNRRMGLGCLLHYYPRRCGGLSPVTMLSDFRRQRQRLRALDACAVLITNSRHMGDEFARHGVEPHRIHAIPYYVYGSEGIDAPAPRAMGRELQLLFMGRMDRLKGGQVLLEALPAVRDVHGQPVRLTFAGDGPAQAEWAHQAAAVQARRAGIAVDFAGWVDGSRRSELLAQADVVVVPSIWPEPFGRVGPEAGFYGRPVAAFAVGGVEEWLTDGVNGHVAPGDAPDAAGLAAAITACVSSAAHHAQLQAGALRLAQRFTRESHLQALLPILEEVAHGRVAVAAR